MSSSVLRSGRSSSSSSSPQLPTDAPGRPPKQAPVRKPSIEGLSAAPSLTPTSRGSVPSTTPAPRRVDLGQAAPAESLEASQLQTIRKFALPLVQQRIKECGDAQTAYLKTPEVPTRIASYGALLLGPLGKVAGTLKLIRGNAHLGQWVLDAARTAKSATGEPVPPGPLKRFSQELTAFGRGYQSVIDAVESMGQLHRMLNQNIVMQGGAAQFKVTRSGLDDLASMSGDLDTHMTKTRTAFDALFDGMERDMPELRGAQLGARAVDLEAPWKRTLEVAVKSHMPDLMIAQGVVNLAHETLLDARLGDLERGFHQLRNDVLQKVAPGTKHLVTIDGAQATQLAGLLKESHETARGYDDFAQRMDNGLRWIDGLRGKPGVNDEVVLMEHCNLLDASTRIDSKALGLFENAREFGGAFDTTDSAHDPVAREAFNEVSQGMVKRVDALRHNIDHCIKAFPNGDANMYLSAGDALRQPVLDAVAQHCDEIETDLAWLRESVKGGNIGLTNSSDVEARYDGLQAAVSRVRRDLQWNVAVADEMKKLARGNNLGGARSFPVPRAPGDAAVRDYVATHLRELSLPTVPEATVPEIDWGDAPSIRPSTSIGGAKPKKTARQRQALAASQQNLRARKAADVQDVATQIATTTKSLADLCAKPFDVEATRREAGSIAARARTEADTNGLHLLSGNGIHGKFMRAARTLDKGRRSALEQIAEIDRSIDTLTELQTGEPALADAKRAARPVRSMLKQHVEQLSGEIDTLRNEAVVQQKRRNVKLFAQKPTRELFDWLQKHDSGSLMSARKTVDRRQLSGVAPNGVRRPHDDFFDEYVITLRDPQSITYTDPLTHTPRGANVTTVPLHVHYRSATATRPEACHFKNQPQSTVGGPDAYRSDDSVALMAAVLKSVGQMANA